MTSTCAPPLTLFLRSIFAALRRRAHDELRLSTRHFQCGSVTMIQPFGDALRLNLHFHSLVLDGVYVRDPADLLATPRFHVLSEPDDAVVADVLRRFARQIKDFSPVR